MVRTSADCYRTCYRAGSIKATVLIVNDQVEQLHLLDALLRHARFDVLTAHDGEEGFDVARQHLPDVIVTDLAMPRSDGVSMCRRIREDPLLRDTPVLIASAIYKDSETAVEALRAGADEYLELPYDPGFLVAKVARLVERHQAKIALQGSQDRVRLLLDSTAEAIFSVDLDGRCTLCNRAAVSMFGYGAEEELVGRSIHGLVHHSHRDGRPYPAANCPIQATVASGQSTHIVGETFWRKDGTSFPAEYWCHPIRKHDRLLGGVVTCIDITDRIHAEEELQRATQHLQAVVANLPIGIWAVDTQGIITVSEGQVVERLGWQPGEQIGRSIFEICADVPAILEIVRRSLAGESSSRLLEVRGITFESRYMPLRRSDGSVTGAISIAIDVSDRVRLEQQLRQAHKMEAVGQLAAGVAHDFNNLLTPIIGFTELIVGRIPRGDWISADLDEVLKAARSAAGLTKQLLAFSRKQILQPQVLDLNSVVRSVQALLRRTIGDDIELVAHLAPALGRITADAGQIEQVILNLAINARDPMKKGGVLTIETANVTLDAAYASRHAGAIAGEHVMLAITDTGTGMDEAVQARLFDPFFTTKERGEGTGLGLATVYGIVKQSGGSIWVYSEVGLGSTFKVYLPRVDQPLAQSDAHTVVPSCGTETVLLVEDQPEVRAAVSAALSRHGYHVLDAAGGVEAMQMAEHYGSGIDLVLTDVIMRTMSGPALVRQLRAFVPSLRVLYMSGYTDAAVVNHGLDGAAFLQKPFQVTELLRKVRDVLDRSP